MFEIVENWAIHAYADGELDGPERKSVEAMLQQNAEARSYYDAIQRQKAALHKAYDGVLEEPIPAPLLNTISQKPEAGVPWMKMKWSRVAMAASVAMLLLGAAGGWYGARYESRAMIIAQLPERALDAHEVYAADFKHPVEVAGSDKPHLETWLSKRIGVAFKIPDLNAKGYSLVGGRLLAEGDKPAGLLMYEDANKERLTIYVAANEAKDVSAMHIQYRGKLMSCYWVEADLVYALVGEQPKDEMIALTQAAHEGFDS